MKLHTKYDIIELNFSNGINTKWLPKLYLDAPRIIISNSFSKYEQIHLDNNLFGSKKFLDTENKIDVMTFHRNNLDMNYLELSIPTSIKNNNDNMSLIYESNSSRNLQINRKQSFSLGNAQQAFYDDIKDVIILQYETCKYDIDIIGVKIAQDFYLLNQDGVIVGWQLVNCSKYLYSTNGIANECINNEVRNALSQFFSAYKETTFEKMLNQDKKTYKQLKKLLKYADDNQVFVITETIKEWLEDNYE